MKVLYFDSKFLTPRHSSPVRAYSFARRLIEEGHEVTMVARDPSFLEVEPAGKREPGLVARERVDDIDILWIKIPFRQRFSKSQRMLSYGAFTLGASIAAAVTGRPDVVYASSTPLTIGIPGVVASRLKGAPFVFELLDLWPAVPVGLGYLKRGREIAAAEWLERKLYDSAERVVVCSEAARDALLAQGVPADKLVLIPNMSDLELFRPGAADESFRARYGLEGKFVAVYAGGMGVANGVYQLADAAAALKRRGIDDVAIVALGRGSERPKLERHVAELGLENLLVLPPVARERIPGIIGAADVTLTVFAPYPVLETNSPNKFFDSLAAGKPVVVNLDGWWRRLVEENHAGVYVPAGDGDALAEALADLARRPELVREMGGNARALAEREFALDLLAERFVRTLEDAASRNGAAAR